MAYYCKSCGAMVEDTANFCPACGAALADNSGSSGTGTGGDTGSKVLKTAAVIGGAAVGGAALSSLARRLTHRRRPPYMDPGPRHGGPGGPGGPGRMM